MRFLEKRGTALRVSSQSLDVLVIGSGIAGCSAALRAAERGQRVTLLTKSSKDPLRENNSYWAQGGIIYKSEDPNEATLLQEDVKRAGAGRCNDAAVAKLASDGPRAVESFLLGPTSAANCPFDRDPSNPEAYALCLEASHSRARIVHWRDHTGRAIMESMMAAVKAHPRIEIRAGMTVVDLLTVEVDDTGVGSPSDSEASAASGPSDDDHFDSSGDEAAAKGADCKQRRWSGSDGGEGESERDGGEAPSRRINVCAGAIVLDEDAGDMVVLPAAATVLATGGCGDLFEHTSNPPGARGDGIAMAIRAGVATSGMEFVQFHPTTLFVPGERRFLLTEALRGEGAVLRDHAGRAFAKSYHPDGELAPRDVVARMITSEIAKQERAFEQRLQEEEEADQDEQGGGGGGGGGAAAAGAAAREYLRQSQATPSRRTAAVPPPPCMYLDITHRGREYLETRFPAIFKHCLARGLDMSSQPLPVVPSAHYFCGGVRVDLDGRTSLPGLFAAGEASCSGLHGANRLASTSLLEGLVWGGSAADAIAASCGRRQSGGGGGDDSGDDDSRGGDGDTSEGHGWTSSEVHGWTSSSQEQCLLAEMARKAAARVAAQGVYSWLPEAVEAYAPPALVQLRRASATASCHPTHVAVADGTADVNSTADRLPPTTELNEAGRTREWLNPNEILSEMKRIMWHQVGIVRRQADLVAAAAALESILTVEIEPAFERAAAAPCEDTFGIEERRDTAVQPRLTLELIAARNAAIVSLAIANAASANTLSVGTHFVEEKDEAEMPASRNLFLGGN